MYVNYATTLLKNWLLKNGCEMKQEAATGSLYFNYGDTVIRLGDHLPRQVDVNIIYIMIPQNNKFYGLFVDRSFLTFNSVGKLKAFINNLFIILSANYKSKLSYGKQDSTLNQVIKTKDEEISKLKVKIANQSKTLATQANLIKQYKDKLNKK